MEMGIRRLREQWGMWDEQGGAVREDFPEEEVTELSLEGLAGAHEVVQAQEVLRTQRAEQRH